MGTEVLDRRFAAIGARIKVVRPRGRTPQIDVGFDRRGEFFELGVAGVRGVSLDVLDVDRDDRCLLLLLRDGDVKRKFLCGFDERHWFVAAVPEVLASVGNVETAKDALQPAAVREAVARRRPKDRHRRRNVAYVRQGEWFFVPAYEVAVDPRQILRNEPLRRGWGKIHRLELAFRRGGETVYVNAAHPNGVTVAEYGRLPDAERRSGDWERMVRDPELYAKGAVRHPDHNTIVLHVWHRVLMNTENEAPGMRHVAFLD
jgi:hypothetical protein